MTVGPSPSGQSLQGTTAPSPARRATPWFAYALTGALVFAVGFVASRAWPAQRTAVPVLTAVRELARLETVGYHLERVIPESEAHSLLGVEYARDTVLLVTAADVTAGVDLASLRDTDVTVDARQHRVRVRLPAPVVFTTALDNAHTAVYRQTDLLARRSEDLESRARRNAEATLRQAAIDQGILVRARAGAEHALRPLLRSLGYDTVEFVWGP